MTDDEFQAHWIKHFEVLADALAAPGIAQQPEFEADKLLPPSAPEWLWEAWEAHEIEWQRWELCFAEIRALPDTEPGACPESEEFVWTEEEIGKDRDFEGGSAVLDDIFEEEEEE